MFNGMSDSSEVPPHVKKLFDSLTMLPSQVYCPKCGSKMLLVETTFFSLGEQFWTIPLPVCSMCDLKEDTARFIPPAVC